MDLRNLLREHRARLVDEWFARVADGYSTEMAAFLKKARDPFANPVGHALRSGLGRLFDGLTSGEDTEAMAPALDDIIRIRAVQEFTASGSVGFVFALKEVVRVACADVLRSEPGAAEELLEFETAIDRLALLAFDTHMKRRERIYEIRANEIRNRSITVLERFQARYEERARKSDSH